MMTGKHALVTGATGAVGYGVVSQLAGAGWRIRILSRSASAGPPGTDVVLGDFTDARTAAAATRGVDAVFHLAAKLHLPNPDLAAAEEFHRINVDGTRTLARAAVESGVARFIHFSTIAVYGRFQGEPFREEMGVRPETAYARSKNESERVVFEETSRGETEAVVLRLAAVYGPHLKGNYLRLARAICRGRFIPIGRGENRRTLVHEIDVGRAAVLAASHARAPGTTFNVTDGTSHSVRDIIAAISDALGQRFPAIHVPPVAMRIPLTAAELPFRLLGRRAPVGTWLLEKYLEEIVASGDAIQHELDFRPQLDLDKGWENAIVGLRERGEIPMNCRGRSR